MTVVTSALSELKVCIITDEFHSAGFAKELAHWTTVLKNCGTTPEIVYLDDYLAKEDKLTATQETGYIDECMKTFQDLEICIPVFDSDAEAKKSKFKRSLLARVLRFMLHVSIVSLYWVKDLEYAHDGYIKSMENRAKSNKRVKPLAVGKTERRFDDELAMVLPYRSCVFNEKFGSFDEAKLKILEIVLNFFGVNTERTITNPKIDGECIVTTDETHGDWSNIEHDSQEVPPFHIDDIFNSIEGFVEKRKCFPTMKGRQYVISSEIESYQPLFSIITAIITKLGGTVIKSKSEVEDIQQLYSVEDDLSSELNYVLPKNRCSLYYILERWGMNFNSNTLDKTYKFSHHYPFDKNNVISKDVSEVKKFQFSLSTFFGHKKFKALTMLKKFDLNVKGYMTASSKGLFAYVNHGEKYDFCLRKNIKIISAKCIDEIYYKAEFDLKRDYSGEGKQQFLLNRPDISNREGAKYYKEIVIEKSKKESPKKRVVSQSSEISQPASKAQPQVKKTSQTPKSTTEVENEKTSLKEDNGILSSNDEEKTIPVTSQSKPSLKRKLAADNSLASQNSQQSKKSKTSIEESSNFDSISERISMAGGNNTDLTYQDTNKRLKVIITGFDIKSETTSTNYVYMSGIKSKKELYSTNMYILDKMGLEICEDKNYNECDMVILSKKTSTFYESLAFDNIKYYVDFKFIDVLLDKVYRRKKAVSLNLEKFWYKELLKMPEFIRNRDLLHGELLFNALEVEHLVLINPAGTYKSDPKEIVFKTHGFSKKIQIKGFDKRQFNLDDCCKDKGLNLIVINNNVKSLTNVVSEIKKSPSLDKYKIIVVTWDTIVKMLLTMDVDLFDDSKHVLFET